MLIVFLLTVFFGKLIDIHIQTDQEKRDLERIDHERELEKNNVIRQDPKSPEEAKYEAMESMIRKGDVS